MDVATDSADDRAAGRSPAGATRWRAGVARWAAAMWPIRPWSHRAGTWLTAAFAALLGVAAVAETLARNTDVRTPGLLVLLSALALATTLPLALPRPTAAAVTVIAAGVLSLAAFDALTVAGVAAQVAAAWRTGRRGHPTVAALAAIPYLLMVPVTVTHVAPRGSAGLAGPVGPHATGGGPVVSGAWHLGTAAAGMLLASLLPAAALVATARRLRREDVRTRAAQEAIAGTLLEHTARGERARIARELHDVVAHHISMVAVQAETARLTTPGMPPAGAQRLSAIGDTARAALTEMRRLLGVLREDARTDGPAVADRRPQPGLRQLADLLDEARQVTGTSTRLILRGPPVALDPGVELAAYRIVQEALTNARRHAPGAAVDVELHYTGAGLRLLVRDNGPGPSAPVRPGGHGLLGMRERAVAAGGQLHTWAGRAGGFVVEARFPTSTEDGR